MDKKKPIIVSLGGSLVVPNGGIDEKFLSEFNTFIRRKIAAGWRFFIVVGGGSTARHYIDAAKEVSGNITDWDLDYLGIKLYFQNSGGNNSFAGHLSNDWLAEEKRRYGLL